MTKQVCCTTAFLLYRERDAACKEPIELKLQKRETCISSGDAAHNTGAKMMSCILSPTTLRYCQKNI